MCLPAGFSACLGLGVWLAVELWWAVHLLAASPSPHVRHAGVATMARRTGEIL
jgi:hypothetical protein